MKIVIYRYSDSGESTLGLLFLDGEFFCYTLEDTYRPKKVHGQTRIPSGTYPVKLRQVGGFFQRQVKRFGGIYRRGTLHIQDVPGFKYILIHAGNDRGDTMGCLLVGDSPNNNKVKPGFLGSSTPAFKRLYRIVSDELARGLPVEIQYLDMDLVRETPESIRRTGEGVL